MGPLLALPLCLLALLIAYIFSFNFRIPAQRARMAKALGISDLKSRKVVGFFHPYW
jgi:hypothetical protein